MNKSMLEVPLSEDDNKRLSKKIEDLQIRDSLRMYNTVVERCFLDCVDSFLRQNLTKQEDACVHRCVDKFIRLTIRTGLRVSDLNPGNPTTPRQV
ncbi:hypothetical protein QQ045_033435 [Rhodiola kirilowii]